MNPLTTERVSVTRFLNLNHSLTLNLFSPESKIKIMIKSTRGNE